MTTTLSTAKLIRLFIAIAIAAVALTGAAYAIAGHAAQSHVAAAGATSVTNPFMD
jgi:hypothetical protein